MAWKSPSRTFSRKRDLPRKWPLEPGGGLWTFLGPLCTALGRMRPLAGLFGGWGSVLAACGQLSVSHMAGVPRDPHQGFFCPH